MIRLICCFILVCMLTSANAQDFNITDFGARPDGKSLNTEAIQQALDAAHKVGGRVIIPEGRFLSGSIIMKDGVELHVEEGGVLLGSTDPADYIKLNRWKALVMADGNKDISVTGHGTIDGQGRKLALHIDSLFYAGVVDSSDYNFVEMRPKYYMRPQVIEFVGCDKVLVLDITLKNAACWVQTYEKCSNVIINNVKVYSDAYWNNDGLDIQDCKNVRVTNCDINSADDGICLKSDFHTDAGCDSIYIANCRVRSSASAIKFGTNSKFGFKNVVIENIKVYDTFRSAIAVESVDGGVLDNVLIQNITATNTGNAIFIRLGHRQLWKPEGVLKNVTIKNVKVQVAFKRPDYNYDIRGPELPFFHNPFPSSITGIPGHYAENVTLENIEIVFPGRANKGLAYMPLSRLADVPENTNAYPEFSMFEELPAWGFYVRHVDGLTMKNIRLILEEPDYRPAFVFDDTHNLSISDLKVFGDDKKERIVLRQAQNVDIESGHNILRIDD